MAVPPARASEYLRSEIDRGTFPGAQYAIGEAGKIVAEDAVGSAVIEPELIPVSLDTIYDLASLTKPLVTSLLVAILAERGLLQFDLPVTRLLEEFRDSQTGDKDEITLLHLLTHTSGLPPWRPLYLEADGVADVVAAIARAPLDQGPANATRVVYSDLNYVLLGTVIERVTGSSLEANARREIFEPLGLRRTMFNPGREIRHQTAATERGQAYELASIIKAVEAGTVSRPRPANAYRTGGDDDLVSLLTGFPADLVHGGEQTISPRRHPLRRTEMIWGEVHDGNAYFLGGAAGHAGLFSTAREVFLMANQFLPGSRLVSNRSVEMFRQNLTGDCRTARSIAWLLASTPDCSAGPSLPPESLGHTGFTGTSVWLDPETQRVFVLLTNRIHPEVGVIDMKDPRQRFHSIAVDRFQE